MPGKDDFTPARRNEFMARIATGDWDAVIVAQSQFTLLPVHPRTEAEFIQRELAGYRDGLSEMADEARAGGDRSWRSSEKSIQKAIQRLSARLLGCQMRLEDRKRLTQTMIFEDLGVDRAFVDITARPHGVLHVGSDPRRATVAYTDRRTYARVIATGSTIRTRQFGRTCVAGGGWPSRAGITAAMGCKRASAVVAELMRRINLAERDPWQVLHHLPASPTIVWYFMRTLVLTSESRFRLR